MTGSNALVETGRDPKVYSSKNATYRKHQLSTAPVPQLRVLGIFGCERMEGEKFLLGTLEWRLGNGMSVDRSDRV